MCDGEHQMNIIKKLLTLNLDWPERHSEKLFVISPQNEKCIMWLNKVALWPNRQIILYGPSKSGKTHLAKIWAKHNDAQIITDDTTKTEIESPFVVDSVVNIKEEAYLKLLFSLARNRFPAIWISRNNIFQHLKTNDMKTRMNTLMSIEIEPPDEALFAEIIHKRCGDYGLVLTKDLIDYIIKRVAITYEAIDQLVRIIHEVCLMEKRPPTIDTISIAVNQFNIYCPE